MLDDSPIFDSNLITTQLASSLIASQFPQYASLPVRPVPLQGHDNRTYRLGEDLLLRLPSAACYALKGPKEQELLPQLATLLPLPIPTPIAQGAPSPLFPFPFSIYRFLPGQSLNQLPPLSQPYQLSLATDLALFLKALQAIKTIPGPVPGEHNWWRGAHPSAYDQQARSQILACQDLLDPSSALRLWDRALSTRWDADPVWIHGDVAAGNILLHNNSLSAVIDFGGMALGDPACDLVIAWTLFNGPSRTLFQDSMNLDDNTWLRARAWALWKATFELCQPHSADRTAPRAQSNITLIADLLAEERL